MDAGFGSCLQARGSEKASRREEHPMDASAFNRSHKGIEIYARLIFPDVFRRA